MYLLDTHVLLWWIAGDARFRPWIDITAAAIPDAPLHLASITRWEVATLVSLSPSCGAADVVGNDATRCVDDASGKAKARFALAALPSVIEPGAHSFSLDSDLGDADSPRIEVQLRGLGAPEPLCVRADSAAPAHWCVVDLPHGPRAAASARCSSRLRRPADAQTRACQPDGALPIRHDSCGPGVRA